MANNSCSQPQCYGASYEQINYNLQSLYSSTKSSAGARPGQPDVSCVLDPTSLWYPSQHHHNHHHDAHHHQHDFQYSVILFSSWTLPCAFIIFIVIIMPCFVAVGVSDMWLKPLFSINFYQWYYFQIFIDSVYPIWGTFNLSWHCQKGFFKVVIQKTYCHM